MSDPSKKIFNTQVLHYSRRNPFTNQIEEEPIWLRATVPWDLNKTKNEWQRIEFHTYSNEDLLAEVKLLPQLLNNSMTNNLQLSKRKLKKLKKRAEALNSGNHVALSSESNENKKEANKELSNLRGSNFFSNS